MSIQPVNKAVEYLINSTPVLEKQTKKNSQCLSYKEHREREREGQAGRQAGRQTETQRNRHRGTETDRDKQ